MSASQELADKIEAIANDSNGPVFTLHRVIMLDAAKALRAVSVPAPRRVAIQASGSISQSAAISPAAVTSAQ